mgnify:CR=1 FL=1
MTCIVIEEDCRTGTDRCAHALKLLDGSLFVNIQGDEPLINPSAIDNLIENFDNNIGVANAYTIIDQDYKLNDRNVVKVITNNDIEKSGFSEALDFKRAIDQTKNKFIYHHIGIYGFTSKALIRYVNLKRSKLELERNLEQMRALENNMKIHVGHIKSNPLGIDTEKDFLEVKKSMEQ